MTVPSPRSLGHGIHVIPAPLPFTSPAFVNAYVVETGDGLLLLDCGTDWEPGRTALSQGFIELGLDETAVHTLVVSHLHPDHVGMSARLVRELGCRFVMHRRASKLVERYNDTPGFARTVGELGEAHGVPAGLLAAGLDQTRPDYMPMHRSPRPRRRRRRRDRSRWRSDAAGDPHPRARAGSHLPAGHRDRDPVLR